MKKTKGKVNPAVANKLIIKELNILCCGFY